MDGGAQGGQAGMGPHHPVALLGLGKGFCCCRCLAPVPLEIKPQSLSCPPSPALQPHCPHLSECLPLTTAHCHSRPSTTLCTLCGL